MIKVSYLYINKLGMQYYKTKGELLERMGKNKGDVRLVDRLMAKGDVRKDENGYYFKMDKIREMYDELKRENEELKEMVK